MLLVLQGALGQQSHPQLQAYLAQQQQLQQQQQQPGRQQYRLIPAAAAQAPQVSPAMTWSSKQHTHTDKQSDIVRDHNLWSSFLFISYTG